MRPEGLFVYGTLKAGERAAGLAERVGLLRREPAVAEGLVLYELPAGYPAAAPGPGRVVGEFLVFRDLGRALALLDRYEEVGREYLRRPLWVRTPGGARLAWVYLYPDARAARRAGGRRLRDGRWSGRLPKKP